MRLEQLCCIGSAASNSVKYVGLNINESADQITVDQYVYDSSMSTIKHSHERAACKISALVTTEKNSIQCTTRATELDCNNTYFDSRLITGFFI